MELCALSLYIMGQICILLVATCGLSICIAWPQNVMNIQIPHGREKTLPSTPHIYNGRSLDFETIGKISSIPIVCEVLDA